MYFLVNLLIKISVF